MTGDRAECIGPEIIISDRSACHANIVPVLYSQNCTISFQYEKSNGLAKS